MLYNRDGTIDKEARETDKMIEFQKQRDMRARWEAQEDKFREREGRAGAIRDGLIVGLFIGSIWLTFKIICITLKCVYWLTVKPIVWIIRNQTL